MVMFHFPTDMITKRKNKILESHSFENTKLKSMTSGTQKVTSYQKVRAKRTNEQQQILFKSDKNFEN